MRSLLFIAATLLALAPERAYAEQSGIADFFRWAFGRQEVVELPRVDPPKPPDLSETCEPPRDYLQPAVKSAVKEMAAKNSTKYREQKSLIAPISLPLPEDVLFRLNVPPPTCIWYAMQWMPIDPSTGKDYFKKSGGLYLKCEKYDSKPRVPELACKDPSCITQKPCISRDYVQLVYETLMHVSSCAELAPRELFPIFRIESNFMTNVASFDRFRDKGMVLRDDAGIAQLTAPAINAVNRSSLLKAAKENPHCARYSELLAKGLHAGQTCERIAMPENPALSMLYGAFYYRILRNSGGRLVESWQNARKSAGLPLLDAKDEKAATVRLTRYMYNGGDGGIGVAFRTYLEEMIANQKGRVNWKDGVPRALGMTFAEFVPAFSKYLEKYYGTGMFSEKLLVIKRPKLAQYPDWVMRYVPIVKERWGVSCGE